MNIFLVLEKPMAHPQLFDHRLRRRFGGAGGLACA